MYVVSTAGHVDHGKSALIERLTGIDPDRLAEEKARGLTIDLGFAWLTLPGGREIGIVDVPGHERFVHNMLAGVGSVDATIFVVAASEGWMPQSEEHLAILDLLEARAGLVALTKKDLVGEEKISRVEGEVRARLAGTALEGAEIVPVSSITGEGVEELVAAMERALDRIAPAEDRGRPRLFVDRSFSVRGSGTVVTGTLTGGTLAVDEEVEVLPAGGRARVRGIQTHKRRRDVAEPGSRVALNLAGLDRTSVGRGDAVVRPGQWRPTATLDVALRTVRDLDHPFTGRGAFKVHVGSAEIPARVRLLERPEARPWLAQLTLDAPVVAETFDRFVLRDVGRQTTVAGGTILDAQPRATGAVISSLRRRMAADREGLPDVVLAERGVVPRADFARLTGVEDPPSSAVALRTYVLSKPRFDELTASIERTLRAFHQREPIARGMPREEARAESGIAEPRLFAEVLDGMPQRIESDGPLVRLSGHRVTLSPEQERGRDDILRTLEESGFAPPSLADLARLHGDKLTRALLDSGELIKVGADIVFSRRAIEDAKSRIAEAFRREGPLTASRIREVLGTSRKYVIPLLEHLDAAGFTKRRGDVREIV
jgi:selenocysteine-specific elongation factor